MLLNIPSIIQYFDVQEINVPLIGAPGWTKIADADPCRFCIGFSPGQNASILISTTTPDPTTMFGVGILINAPGFREFPLTKWGALTCVEWFALDTGGSGFMTVFTTSIRLR